MSDFLRSLQELCLQTNELTKAGVSQVLTGVAGTGLSLTVLELSDNEALCEPNDEDDSRINDDSDNADADDGVFALVNRVDAVRI